MSKAYYNENDKFAAAWLRELITAGLIAPGDVDERSIVDVRADDLAGYTQCHFFAGIGVWSYALRNAGWPDHKTVWTGSCPCQPFSAAGKRKGAADERHLWPELYRLINECRPAAIFGEQVASKDGLAWLDTVQADLENSHYAFGAADLCAASVGAPHIRQRLWFVAQRLGNSSGERLERHARNDSKTQRQVEGESIAEAGILGRLANTSSDRWSGQGASTEAEKGRQPRPNERRELAQRLEGRTIPDREAGSVQLRKVDSASATNGFWASPDWLYCGDNKWRPVEPGTSPLVNGAASRVAVVCSECKTETRWIDGQANEIDTTEAVQILRCHDEKKTAAKREHGERSKLHEKAFLLSEMLRAFKYERAENASGLSCSSAEALQSELMQSVRVIREYRGSSHRQKPVQQQHRELGAALSKVPSQRTQGSDFDVYLRRLQSLIQSAKPSEQEQDLLCPVCERIWPHLCEKEMVSRAAELRGYGNAINAEVARIFIESAMEAIA